MKDNFSSESDKYARYRPQYPLKLISYITNMVSEKEKAWDCATGNGQLATKLSKHFTTVEATDISKEQIKHAHPGNNINYSIQAAEETSFPNEFFDLITVGQAVHWFNFEKFYAEVNRVLKSQGILALIGYGLVRSNKETNKVIDHFYKEIIGPYWDWERKYLDEKYETIPFPFEEIIVPDFEIKLHWTYEHLVGYLRTWSAVKHFQEKNGKDPVELITKKLKNSYGEGGEVVFPLLVRVGRK
ncbi:class I SAM-dependent methyltransferase [Antarcticibacterium sp. 1MA-6-2]|uniref:class I SAM-dependent methyltransferase n=1 Tax=Antarcticibacterium sp. 1MA-6-2 TaxID=2908210 RepID=UPI001F3328FA|nr:class I SAM-dependent methyltransferase [Antarcticibacterium sp. 1MA-6-2]UJH91803.1 class I SAM-dependent methyltransferase [Antarcticibacterium sp. 1MA-6-2]